MPDQQDTGYKKLFANAVFMRQLVESFIKEPWVRKVDFSRAERVDKSYVSRQFRKLESDIIWKLYLKDGEELFLYILIEFQSTVDHFMALRMLRYIVEFYFGIIGRSKKRIALPSVFPVLLYNGEDRWTAPERLEELIDQRIDPKFLPHFRYFKIAENEIGPKILFELKNLISALFLVETSDPDTLHEKTELILDILRKERPEETCLFTEWLHQHFDGAQEPFVDKIDTLQEVRTMLAAALKRKEEEWKRIYLNEGKLEGKLEGKQEGARETTLANARAFKKLGVDVNIIVKATGLAREEVEKI